MSGFFTGRGLGSNVNKRWVGRSWRSLLLLLLLAGVTGCQRGCLSSWLGEHGVGGARPETQGESTQTPSALGGTDCSDGLMRCVDGNVERSILAHLSSTCGATPEKKESCVCPWESVARCTSGCAVDPETVIVVTRALNDGGVTRLCRADSPIALPLTPDTKVEVEVCSASGFACRDSIVVRCERPGQPAKALGRCLFGCDEGLAMGDGETTDLDGALAILCRRHHAERR